MQYIGEGRGGGIERFTLVVVSHTLLTKDKADWEAFENCSVRTCVSRAAPVAV